MARALGFRQIRLLSFSSQRSRTITWEYNQIISTSRWVKKVELYTSMLTCISQDGNDLIILETEDSTIQPALLALLVLRSEQQMPLRAYCEERFRITVSLGPGSALGEKGKRRGQIGKISASEVSRARFFFFFRQRRFFPLFPTMWILVPGKITVKPRKPWTPEIFLECYCVARKKSIMREKTKRQARTLITVCGFVASSRVLIFAVIGHNAINTPEIISSVHDFPSLLHSRF